MSAGSIRIMTYNIRGGLGMDDRRSISRVADVIRASSAEVVCLQEVHQRLPHSRFVDQPKWLAERLGMRFAFQRNLSFGPGGFGNAILTKFGIHQTRSHRLTSSGEQRGLLETHLETPEGRLVVFCTHLGLAADERGVQAREVAAAVDSIKGPKIICGDFNEEISESAVSELVSSAGLVDAASDGGATFPSAHPTRRIDMFLCDSSLGVASVSVPLATASDHLPVVADILLPAGEMAAHPHKRHDLLA